MSTNKNIDHCFFVNEKIGSTGKIKVISETLDNLLKNNIINNIGYIHLDVEGMESKVISGAIDLISKYVPIITFEQHLNQDNYKDILDLLVPKKYSVFLINEKLPGCRPDCRNSIAFPNNYNINNIVNNIHSHIGTNILIKKS